MTVLAVRNLSVTIPTGDGDVHAVQDVSFSLGAEEMFCIVGESGSGKSVLSKALLGLIPGAETSGEVMFGDQNLLRLKPRQLQKIRGDRIAMISQDPLSGLHPYFTVGAQISEALRTHRRMSRRAALAEAVAVLGRVGIHDPEARVHDYPHQFSGGMRQRVMIAMAIVLRPAVLIADEPTTALDVTVQAQIIELLNSMRRELGTAIIMVTHDLGLVSSIADNAMVMYAGNRMEIGAGPKVLGAPRHPYTRGLLNSSPSRNEPGAALPSIPGQPPSLLDPPPGCRFAPRCPLALDRCKSENPPLRGPAEQQFLCWLEEGAAPGARPVQLTPASLAGAARAPGDAFPEHQAPAPAAAAVAAPAGLPEAAVPAISIRDLRLSYPGGGLFGRGKPTEVLKGISLELPRGRTLGIVGESGSGKSTLARVVAALAPASSGSVEVLGRPVTGMDAAEKLAFRRKVQMVFQDPFGALNPRRRVGAIIGDPFRIHGLESGEARRAKVRELMDITGLNPEHYNRFPSEFSGGQRQRICIARALALRPEIIIFDEPVSALDVSIQAQILNLIRELQTEFNMSYLFISHDLSVVRHVSDTVAVMQSGLVVETGETARIYAAPAHPYTRELLAASDPDSRAGRMPAGAEAG